MINKHYKGSAAKQLREIFSSYLDLDNYVRIVRMKTYYHAPPEAIREALLPFSTIRKSFLEDMINAKSEEEIQAIMAKDQSRQALSQRRGDARRRYPAAGAVRYLPARYPLLHAFLRGHACLTFS